MKTSSQKRQQQQEKPSRFIVAACLVLIALYAYGTLEPGASTWGFHTLGFFPPFAAISVIAIMLLLTTYKGYSFVLRLFQTTSNKNILSRFSSPVFLLLCVVIAALFWIARESTFLLGDGALISRTVQNIVEVQEVVIAFRNEPLAGWLAWQLYRLLSWLQVQGAHEYAFRIISIGFGLAFVATVLRLAQEITNNAIDRLLLGAFILASGSLQLFFGYVELYAPAMLGLALYFTLSLKYLQSKISLLYPSLAFGVLAAFHLGMLSLAPSMLLLVVLELRQRRTLSAATSAIASAGIFAVLVIVSGYSPATFWANLAGGDKQHFLTLAMTGNSWQSYTLFSPWHVIDFANLLLLVSPFALFLILTFARKHQWNTPASLFLGTASFCGLLFAFAVNADLGMSRDWDLFCTFMFPLLVLAGFLWANQAEQRTSLRQSLAIVVGITLLHTGLWIALNADGARSMARFTSLSDERLWSKGARGNAYEELAVYYRDRKDHALAQRYWEQYVALDSTNARIWMALAYSYRRTKDVPREIKAWEQALRRGTSSEEIYSDLGILYLRNQQLEDAYSLTTKGLGLYPASARVLNNMGVILMQRGSNCVTTLPYFLEAIKSDSTFAEPYLNAGLCYEMTRAGEQTRNVWEKFLQLAPEAPQAAQVRQRLAKAQR